MSEKKLQLVFDPNLAPQTDTDSRTVLCFQRSADRELPGESLKSFCGEGYDALGRAVALWWFRRFSTPNGEGKTLHDLFEREGTSALWFTRNLFLYEDFGIFLRTLVAIRSLELFRSGEVEEIDILGDPQGLWEVLDSAGCPFWILVSGEDPASVSSRIDKLGKALRGLHRRFVHSKNLRRKFQENHRPNQSDTLLYSVVQGEWNSDGTHRYLQETVEELLGTGEFRSARPIVYGIPPSFEDNTEWREFLRCSLDERGGVYPMSSVSFSEYRGIRAWVADRMSAYRDWLDSPPPDWGRLRGFDLFPLIRFGLADLASQLERGLIMHLAFKKAFESIRPKGFLLKDEVYPHGRIMIAAARAARVPTVALQHGSIYPTHWCYLMDPDATGLARQPLPDTFGVYGSAVVDLLAGRNGFPEEILRPVGARRFKHLHRLTPSPEFVELKAAGAPLILVAGQLHQDMPKVYSWLFMLARQNPHLNFIFKPHPRDREGVDAIQAKCTDLPNARMFRGPVGDLLPVVDLVVSCHSTVLLEAVWLGVGGISVLVSGEPAADWQTRAGLLKIARTQEELTEAFETLSKGRLFSETDRDTARDYLEEYLGYSQVGDNGTLSGIFSQSS